MFSLYCHTGGAGRVVRERGHVAAVGEREIKLMGGKKEGGGVVVNP